MSSDPGLVVAILTKDRPGSFTRTLHGLKGVRQPVSALIVVDSSIRKESIDINRRAIGSSCIGSKYYVPLCRVAELPGAETIFSYLRRDLQTFNARHWNTPLAREMAFCIAATISTAANYLFIDDDVLLEGGIDLPSSNSTISPFEISGTPDYCRLGWANKWMKSNYDRSNYSQDIPTESDLPIRSVVRQRLSYGSGMAFVTNVFPREFIPLPDCYGEDVFLLSKHVSRNSWQAAGEVIHAPPHKHIMHPGAILREMIGQSSVNALLFMQGSPVSLGYTVKQAWLLGLSDIDESIRLAQCLIDRPGFDGAALHKLHALLNSIKTNYKEIGFESMKRILCDFMRRCNSRSKIRPELIACAVGDLRF